jgi:hypothetical protein
MWPAGTHSLKINPTEYKKIKLCTEHNYLEMLYMLFS